MQDIKVCIRKWFPELDRIAFNNLLNLLELIQLEVIQLFCPVVD